MGGGEYKSLLRYKLLSSIIDKMDDSEKLAFLQMSISKENHRETMNALQSLGRQVDASRHSWPSDFGANVAGNAVFDGAVWLLSKVMKGF